MSSILSRPQCVNVMPWTASSLTQVMVYNLFGANPSQNQWWLIASWTTMNVSEMLTEIQFFNKKVNVKISSANCRSIFLGLNVLTYVQRLFKHIRAVDISFVNKPPFCDANYLAARQLMVLSIVEEDVGLHRNGADCCVSFLSERGGSCCEVGLLERQLIL